MIVPMKKVTLLVLKKEQRHALKDLRSLGLVHIEDRPANGTLINELRSEKNDITLAMSLLTEYLPKKEKKGVTPPSLLSEEDTLTLVDSVLNLTSLYKSNIEERGRLIGEISSYDGWGEINSNDFRLLAENGVYLFPASTSLKTYNSLSKEIKTILVEKGKTNIRFLIWSDTNELPSDLPQDVIPLKLPDTSVKELNERLTSLQAKIASYKQEMRKMASYLNSLQALDEIVSKKLQFEIIHEGMQVVALNDSDDESQKINLVYLTGYIPCEDEGKIASLAEKNAWGYISDDPAEDDPVPTKLKYNKITAVIAPLTDFLGTVPGYREPDISIWFLLFFGIFFAMIFGDGGYGLLTIAISIGMMIKAKTSGEKITAAMQMFLYLGVMTTIWGVLTCSWFGADPAYLPQGLKSIAVYGISAMENAGVRNKNIMHVSFTIGIIHLSIAHIIGIIRNRKSLRFLADVGSLGMLLGMYFVILNIIISAEKYPITNAVKGAILLGFVVNFIFANYEGSIGKSIGEAFKNLISMILGVVNVFSDLMSYIRLWAVGLAGGAISMTVNTMACPMLGGFIIFIGIVLLVFGHGLNCIMNVLSVIVHGVRLNTMEFSTHVGLTWSGFKYMPFSEKEMAEK